jgi:hypothetical protein
VWSSLIVAGWLAQASAGALADEQSAPPAPEEEEPAVQPCVPQPGQVIPGPCSPAPPPESPPPAETPVDERVEAILRGDDEKEKGWLDTQHGQVQESFTSLVYRLDQFFGDPSHYQFATPSSRIRLRGGVRVSQPDPAYRRFEPTASILADLRLPQLDRLLSRARLFIAGGSDEEERESGTEQDLVPRRFSPSVAGGGGAAELRFDLYRARRTVVDAGAGVRFRLPPPPYARARVAHAEELGLGLVGHVNQTVFWQREEGFGESSRVDVERVFGPQSVARVWGIATLHERSRGLEWGAETGLQQGLGRRTGVYLAAGLEGATRSNAKVDRYRVRAQLRRDVHQGWVFVDLEPEVSWPVSPAGERMRALATTVRLELQLTTRRRRP